MKDLLYLLALGALLCSTSCSPGLGNTIEVSTLPEIEPRFVDEALRTVRVNVRKFSDARSKSGSVTVNSREVEVGGDLGAVVQSGFEEGIKAGGGALCLFDCAALTGEILRWEMQVKPAFPASRVEARASIRVSVLTREGKSIFTGEYSGKMMGEHPYYNEDRMLDAFGTAMSEAIQSALRDPRLIDELNRRS